MGPRSGAAARRPGNARFSYQSPAAVGLRGLIREGMPEPGYVERITPSTPQTAMRAADLIVSLGVQAAEGETPAALVQIALDTDLTAYDAAYLDLARRTGRALLTFDRRLAAAAGRFGVKLA